MAIDTWPVDRGGPIYIRGYHARTYEALIESFHSDAMLLLKLGYEPAGQHYIEGVWSVWWLILAAVLTPFLIGIVVWLYLLISRPIGTLTVTYVRRTATP